MLGSMSYHHAINTIPNTCNQMKKNFKHFKFKGYHKVNEKTTHNEKIFYHCIFGNSIMPRTYTGLLQLNTNNKK